MTSDYSYLTQWPFELIVRVERVNRSGQALWAVGGFPLLLVMLFSKQVVFSTTAMFIRWSKSRFRNREIPCTETDVAFCGLPSCGCGFVKWYNKLVTAGSRDFPVWFFYYYRGIDTLVLAHTIQYEITV